MIKKSITSNFASGGITSHLIKLLEEGLFRKLYDVQTFARDAILSLNRNKNHIEMSADIYANPKRSDLISILRKNKIKLLK